MTTTCRCKSYIKDQNQIIKWAKPYVETVVKQGTLYGYPDGSFKPKAPITRAEAAAVIYRLIHIH
ncbi:S-layer homology domain-containing protein [Paenibacillus sp. PsM32]|uniref:S-layer homology domain-containing protein n=1 Tax=Paenibacillus sp. PsM32 TaxID=3030536 RepID=UPI00345ED624